MGADLGDRDPHELVGRDIVIEYRMRVQRVDKFRWCMALEGDTPEGEHIVITITDSHLYAIRERTPRRGWRRWPRRR